MSLSEHARRVLIADDSESGRDLLRFILRHSGYEVMEAVNGEEALRLASMTTPDMFILDLNMPRVDGYAVAAQLRANARYMATPIVALSAEVSQAEFAKASSSGFDLFLPKPIAPAQLRECVAGLFANSH